MGDVVDLDEAREARWAAGVARGMSEAHEEMVDQITERMRIDPLATGVVVLTLASDGQVFWSTRYKDGLERKRLLDALDVVRRKVEGDPYLRDDEPEPPRSP